jgi:hypothetical protein
LLFCLSWPVSFLKTLLSNHFYNTLLHLSKAKWLMMLFIMFSSTIALAQDKKPVNNKRQINEMRAKSVKKKEKATTKDIAGKRLRTKNKSSTADRALYANPSPYADKKRSGDDRAPKGNTTRIRSRSAEAARENVYPNKGAFANRSSSSGQRETGRTAKTNYTRKGKLSNSQNIRFSGNKSSAPRSRTSSAESARSNVYPQKGPFVNNPSRDPGRGKSASRAGRASVNVRSSRQQSTEARGGKVSVNRYGRTGKLSTSASFSRNNRSQPQRSPSRSTERAYVSQPGTTRSGKLSAGPVPTGKSRRIAPLSASRPYVTKGKKDVYWGKFSKGERAITTDISGNPLRRRNYSTPPNEIVQSKNPYEGRKPSKGDRAYSGTFKSGHVSTSKTTERPWKGDISGSPIRKRSTREGEVAGERIWSPNMASGLRARIMRGDFSRRQGIKPDKGGGSISASGKYQSNQRLPARTPGIGAGSIMKSQAGMKGIKPEKGGGSISASGKYQSNQRLPARTPGIGAASIMKSQAGMKGIKPEKGGGSVSGTMWNNNNKPIMVRAPGKGGVAVANYSKRIQTNQSAKTFSQGGLNYYRGSGAERARNGNLDVATKAKNNNKPIMVRAPGKGGVAVANYSKRIQTNQSAKTFSQGGLNYYRGSGAERARNGNLSATDKAAANNNNPLPSANYGKTANRVARFQGNMKTREPDKGGGSVSGKLWNNNGKPIEVRMPKGDAALEVGYSGFIKQSGFKRPYEQNPNANKNALKKQKPMNTVYMADGLQVSVKAKETAINPNAAKGSMPGIKPGKATVKAGEYASSMKMYWSYKQNPSSAEESQKTIAPSKSFLQASDFGGRTRLTKNYVRNPNSDKAALKVLAPGRAYARITDYQGNVKMKKYNDPKYFPDAKFAHTNKNNVKEERTIGMDLKLMWSKLFKKNDIQPSSVKEKPTRPRYDKNEKELWKDLYD